MQGASSYRSRIGLEKGSKDEAQKQMSKNIRSLEQIGFYRHICKNNPCIPTEKKTFKVRWLRLYENVMFSSRLFLGISAHVLVNHHEVICDPEHYRYDQGFGFC